MNDRWFQRKSPAWTPRPDSVRIVSEETKTVLATDRGARRGVDEELSMVRVEFYGIPRQRAGVSHTKASGQTLGDVLHELASRYPALGQHCFAGGRLQEPYAANLNGERFVKDAATALSPSDCLLILGADAGG